MTRTNEYQEPFKKFVVRISFDNRPLLESEIKARTDYEAIDKAYTRFKEIAPNRSDYIVIHKRKTK